MGSPPLTRCSLITRFLNNPVYFGTLIFPFSTKSILRLHGCFSKVSKNIVSSGLPVIDRTSGSCNVVEKNKGLWFRYYTWKLKSGTFSKNITFIFCHKSYELDYCLCWINIGCPIKVISELKNLKMHLIFKNRFW